MPAQGSEVALQLLTPLLEEFGVERPKDRFCGKSGQPGAALGAELAVQKRVEFVKFPEAARRGRHERCPAAAPQGQSIFGMVAHALDADDTHIRDVVGQACSRMADVRRRGWNRVSLAGCGAVFFLWEQQGRRKLELFVGEARRWSC